MSGNVFEIISSALILCATPSATAQVYSTPDSSVNHINSIAVQGEYIWYATSDGVVRLDTRNMSYIRYTTRDGLVDNDVVKVAIAPDGAIWTCSQKGVSFYREWTGAEWSG